MTLEEIRQVALQLASQHSYEVPEAIAARAKVYADFIDNGSVPPIPAPKYTNTPGGLCGQAMPGAICVDSYDPNQAGGNAAQSQQLWDAIKNVARR